MKQEIGAPEDFYKNQQKNYFPTHTDISIPSMKRQSDIDLEDALGDMELSQNDKPPNNRGKKSFGDTGDQYMPIGALNQFSLDFKFKARVVKKYPIRTY